MSRFSSHIKYVIGYGYNLETIKLDNYNSGSHEVFLRYAILKNNAKFVKTRCF